MKKITNLLILALLTIGMGLTSCDEQLDNAVVPGVMPDVEVTSITLSETSLKIQVDESYALTATVEPADADYEKIIWSSSDETIATVDENGLIHSVAEGNVIITAQAGNMKATCDVLVKDEYTAINQYKEATWDGTNNKVVFKKKSVESVAEITDGYTGTITSGWYSVTGNDVTIGANVILTGDLHLILCDGAKLTINGMLKGELKNLSIYGQANQTGQLVVNYSVGAAIYDITTLEVHSCNVTATSSADYFGGFYGIGTFNVYGGSVDAECTGTKGFGIKLVHNGSMNIYGGEVKAVGNGNDDNLSYGITCYSGGSSPVTVYGGKLWAECAGNKAFDGHVTLTKDNGYTSGKIQTSDNGSSWTDYKDAATPDAKYVKVE